MARKKQNNASTITGRGKVARAAASRDSSRDEIHDLTPRNPTERLSSLVLFGGIVYLCYLLWGQLSGVLFPVVFALVLAYLLHPVISWLSKKGLSAGAGMAIVFGAFFLLFIIFILVIYPIIAREVSGVIVKFPALIDLLENKALPWLQENAGLEIPTTISGALESYGASLKEAMPGLLNKAGSWALTALTSTGSVLSSAMNLVLIPLFTFYFLKDFQKIQNFFMDLIPEKNRERIMESLRRVDAVVGHWLRGQIEVALVLSLVYGIGLAIVFGFSGFGAKSGFAIGGLTGLMNIIPYIGVAVGLCLSLILSFIEWNGIYPVIGILAVFGAAQILDGYFITPKIVGEKVGLGTAAVLISLLIGGSLFGLIGMLIAIPCSAALTSLWPDFLGWYRSRSFYK